MLNQLLPPKTVKILVTGIILIGTLAAKADDTSDPSVNGAEISVIKGIGSIDSKGSQDPHLPGSGSASYGLELQKNFTKNLCAEAIYLNDGQYVKDAPDSFGLMGCYKVQLGHGMGSVIIQASAGLAGQFNSSSVNGVGIDAHQWGAINVAMAEIALNNRGTKLKLELDHTTMFGKGFGPDDPRDRTTINVGIAQDLKLPKHYAGEDDDLDGDAKVPAKWSLILDKTHGNYCCDVTSKGFEVSRTTALQGSETGFILRPAVYDEGDLKGHSDRIGASLQSGYQVASQSGIVVSGTGGVAVDDDLMNKTIGHGLVVEMRVEKCFRNTRDICIGARWKRAANQEAKADPDSIKPNRENDVDTVGVVLTKGVR